MIKQLLNSVIAKYLDLSVRARHLLQDCTKKNRLGGSNKTYGRGESIR